jgi:hypothetical protein
MEHPITKLMCNKYELSPTICLLYHSMFAPFLYFLGRQMLDHMYCQYYTTCKTLKNRYSLEVMTCK